MSSFMDHFTFHAAREHAAEVITATFLVIVLMVIAHVDTEVFVVSLGVLIALPFISKIFGDTN
jgi:hypothetical protein